jgi:hypothetical protein
MWVALGWLAILTLEATPHKKSWKAWLAWIGTSAAGLYSSYLFPFALIGQGLYLVLRLPKQRMRTVISGALAGAAFLPWLPSFQRQLADSEYVRTALPNWGNVVGTPITKSLLLVVGKFVFGISDLELNLLTLVLLAAVGSGVALLAWWALRLAGQKLTQQRQQFFWLIICWLVLPIVLAWLVSFKIPILQAKRVLFALPAWTVLVGWLCAQPFKLVKQQLTAQTLLALALGIQIVSLIQYWRQPQLQREDWRQLISTIQTQYPDGVAVAVFAFDQPFAPWIWYADTSFPTVSLGQLATNQIDLTNKLKTVTEYRYVLTFDYLTDLTDPSDQVLLEISQLGYDQVSVIDQPVIGFVRVFARPNTVIGLAE